jgi:hypothetical protein
MRPCFSSCPLWTCILLIACAGCSHDAFDDINASKGRSAIVWMLEPPTDADIWGSAIDRAQWEFVRESEASDAESLLNRTSALPLSSEDQLARLAPGKRARGTPYLVRAVAAAWPRTVATTASIEIHVSKNGDLWVQGMALSHHPVPIERQAIVVWLDRPPQAVYVTFSVAE